MKINNKMPGIWILAAVGGILLAVRLFNPSGMSFQEWSWLATSLGVFFTGLKALQDWEVSRVQHAEEFRWKKGELAMKVLDAMHSDTRAKHALSMIDWSNHEYPLSTGTRVHIQWSDVKKALRAETPGKLEFGETEYFIRDSFDGLFDHIERIAHLIRIGLIVPDDIRHPLSYWANRMLSGEIPDLPDASKAFMRFYGYRMALDLMESLCESRGSTAGQVMIRQTED